MNYLLSYDISNDKSRKRVSDYLLEKGFLRIQNSVFLGEIHITKIDNILNIEVFYKKSPYHKGSVVNSTSPYNLLNNFYSFGFELLPQVELNKYFDLIRENYLDK